MISALAFWSHALTLLTRPAYVAAGMPMSWGDIAGFVTGILCVWLGARANIWNFPMGVANSAILGLVFVQQRLFADASLQVLFIAFNVQGWFAWHLGHHAEESAPVFRSTVREHLLLVLAAIAATFALWHVVGLLKGSAPLIDALITSLSLAAQWLLNRRMLENWIWWIVVDLISIPLYVARGLPLIAVLYVVFLALCVQGFVRWRRQVAPSAMPAAA